MARKRTKRSPYDEACERIREAAKSGTKELYLRGLDLDTLLPQLFELTNLTHLDLRENRLSSLPPEFAHLANLKTLYLNDNQLCSLPPELAQLADLTRLDVSRNPLPEPLLAAAERGLDDLRAYLRGLQTEARKLYEAKLVLVGEGNVGKTSLLACVLGENFVEGRPTTHGIERRTLELPHPELDETITLNAWDFGGQPVYRVTHQFFFSPRSLYLVVWWPREGVEKNEVEGWIERIVHRVGTEVRILLVSTHCETGERLARIDVPYLRSKFGDVIVGFHDIDSKTGAGISDLENAIAHAAAQLPHMGEPFPAKWKDARDEVCDAIETQITLDRFTEICRRHELEPDAIRTLAALMNDLGDVIHYPDDEALRNIIVRQPQWLTKAISFVLEDEPTNKAHGVLEHARLRHVWNDEEKKPEDRYDPELHPYFLRLMEKFDVCYRLDEDLPDSPSTQSLVAQLVPGERPSAKLPWARETPPGENELVLVCETEGEAPGLIPWLIVRTHRFSHSEELHWQRGMFLEYDHHGTALLEREGNNLVISVRAEYPAHFMSILSDHVTTLMDIHWPGLDYRLTVPCPRTENGKRCTGRLRLDVLRKKHARAREPQTQDCPACGEPLPIQQLLLGFETEKDVTQQQFAEIRRELLRAADERRRYHELSSDERDRIASEFEKYSRSVLRALGAENRDCPRLFTLLPEDYRKLDPRRLFQQRYRVTLWCEYLDQEHPVCPIGSDGPGEYLFERKREWFAQVTPYARLVLTLLQASAITGAAAARTTIDPVLLTDVGPSIDAMEKLTDLLLKQTGRLIEGSTHGRIPHEGAGLREFHSLLLELDPQRTWGNLRRVLTPDGLYLWLCPTHYREYEPGLPYIPDAPANA